MKTVTSQPQIPAAEFFDRNPVFRTEHFHTSCCENAKRGSRANLLNYFVRRGRILSVCRGVYAVIPYGRQSGDFKPNRYLVASALRPDTILCYHTALEALGQAHSNSRVLYSYTAKAPGVVSWNDYSFRMLRHPKALRKRQNKRFGVVDREVEGQTVMVTGPERTLVDCMTSPRYAGGVEEAVVSLRGIPVFDFALIEKYLRVIGTKRVFAAVGAFLEQERHRLFVPDEFLNSLRKERPKSRTYLERRQRGGVYLKPWNLIVPGCFTRAEGALEIKATRCLAPGGTVRLDS